MPSDGFRRAYYFKACDAANLCTNWGDNVEAYVFMDATGPTAPGPTTTACAYAQGETCWVTGNFTIAVTPASDGGSGVNPGGYHSLPQPGPPARRVRGLRSHSHVFRRDFLRGQRREPAGGRPTAGLLVPRQGLGGERRSLERSAVRPGGPLRSHGQRRQCIHRLVLQPHGERHRGRRHGQRRRKLWHPRGALSLDAAHNATCTSGAATNPGGTINVPAGDNWLYLCAKDYTGRIGYWNGGPYRVQARAPWSGQPVSLPGVVQAENYDLGGEGLAYHDTTPGNVFGVYRTDGMDVASISSANGGGYHLGNVDTGEWAEYQVNITQTQNYELLLRLASGYVGTAHFRFLLDGVDISGSQAVSSTGGWDTYIQRVIPVGILQAGNLREIRLALDDGAWDLDWFELRPATCSPPAITLQPKSKNIDPHQSWTLTGGASGSPAPALQWLKDGQILPGATASTLTITDAREDDIASYKLRAANGCGTVESNAASLNVLCSAPLYLEESIAEVLQGRPAVCNWRSNYAAQFPNSIGGGSDNLPVLAAAIALVADPNLPGPDAQNPKVAGWWEKYLSGELGERGSQWYYGGKEPFSYIYEHFNILSVMAVHHQADRAGLTTLRDLARRWLRATFALQAAAAAPGPVTTLHDRGLACPADNYNGPYLPMAGMRSTFPHWPGASRGVPFAGAIGAGNNGRGETAEQKALRTYLESNWRGPGGSVYGLTAAEAADLAAIRLTGVLPAFFSSTIAGLHTIVPYHIVAWPGVRATLMEANVNHNTVPTYGVVFFASPQQAGGNEAHFLYPWNRGTIPSDPCTEAVSGPSRQCITGGAATLDLQGHFIQATNLAPGEQRPACCPLPGEKCSCASCQEGHPTVSVRIDLPTVPEQYHIALTP